MKYDFLIFALFALFAVHFLWFILPSNENRARKTRRSIPLRQSELGGCALPSLTATLECNLLTQARRRQPCRCPRVCKPLSMSPAHCSLAKNNCCLLRFICASSPEK